MMSELAREFFATSPFLTYPVLALVVFLIVFGAIFVRALRQKPEELDALARIPLADDVPVTRAAPLASPVAVAATATESSSLEGER